MPGKTYCSTHTAKAEPYSIAEPCRAEIAENTALCRICFQLRVLSAQTQAIAMCNQNQKPQQGYTKPKTQRTLLYVELAFMPGAFCAEPGRPKPKQGYADKLRRPLFCGDLFCPMCGNRKTADLRRALLMLFVPVLCWKNTYFHIIEFAISSESAALWRICLPSYLILG